MKKDELSASAKPSVQVLERMFTLIDVLASREEAVSLKEISERTGLHPSTTHRILNDLALGRFVDRPPPSHSVEKNKFFFGRTQRYRTRI